MQRLVLTGGLGFIGSNLIRNAQNKFDILVIDNGMYGEKNLELLDFDINYKKFDIANTHQIASLLEVEDVIVHLAARGNVVESVQDPILNLHSNVLTTLSLLEAMRIANCKKIIFSSTGGALMGNAKPPVNESTNPSPISPYGASKLSCEGYLNAYANSYGIRSIILRFGNVYGPFSLHKKGVINHFIKSSINNQKVDVYDSLETTRDYIHVDDICRGILLSVRSLLSNDNLKSIFHLSNGREVSIDEIIKVISTLSGKELQHSILPPRKGEVIRNCSDFTLAKNKLGFQPQVRLEDGVKNLYNWLENFM